MCRQRPRNLGKLKHKCHSAAIRQREGNNQEILEDIVNSIQVYTWLSKTLADRPKRHRNVNTFCYTNHLKQAL